MPKSLTPPFPPFLLYDDEMVVMVMTMLSLMSLKKQVISRMELTMVKDSRFEIDVDMDVPTQLLSKFERHIVAIPCRDGTVG